VTRKTPYAEVKRIERELAARELEREERRKAAARRRRRLLQLHAIGATTIDEQRELFGSTVYPRI
jgi:hypothetical protein